MTGGLFVLATLVLVASAFFLAKRGLRYLQFFQQEGYDETRFVRWYTREAAYDRRGSVVLLVFSSVIFLIGHHSTVALVLELSAVVLLLAIAFYESDPRQAGKLPLHMTERATRIYHVYLLLVCISLLLTFFVAVQIGGGVLGLLLLQIFMFQGAPFAISFANRILTPYEHAIQQRFLVEAKKKFADVKPFVVGITGSYGKTTTKNILGQIMSGGLGSTFWPEKGINTPMGITRALRTKLQSHHKYAVVEMGAYQIGSIRRLCQLTPPDAAIITAVGIMHLDRFDGQENIYKGKSELAQAVPADGILVCNGDNEGARRMATEFAKKTTLLYGLDESLGDLDCRASQITTTRDGTKFRIYWQGTWYDAFMPLFGMAALSNVLGCFCMACALGSDPEYVVALLASLEQVENRLYVDRQGDITYLRDAYNSNPTGFAAALDLLKAYPAQRRILMTPGMIELGDLQHSENKRIAEKAAEICDRVYIVSDVNREALVAGLLDGGIAEAAIQVLPDRTAAFALLAEEQQAGDVVLIENDLPDVLETKEKF